MRILLVVSPSSWFVRTRPIFPLGVASIATVLAEDLGADLSVVDLNCAKDPWAALRHAIETGPFDFVGVSWRNYTYYSQSQYNLFERTIKDIRRQLPETPIVAGGQAFSLLAGQCMARIPEIDFGVVGDGEAPMKAIVSGNYRSCDGVLYRREDGTPAGRDRLNPTPLAELPIPRREWPLLELRYYKMLNLQTSRGCDRRCKFCVRPRINAPSVEEFPSERVSEELEYLQSLGVDSIFVVDAYANKNVEQTLGLVERMRRTKFDWWTGLFKPDVFNEDIARAFSRSRICYPIFGVDSASERMMEIIGGGVTMENYRRILRLCPADLKPVFTFMTGMPGETRMETLATVKEVLRLSLNRKRAVLEPYIAYPYSPFSAGQGLSAADWDPMKVIVKGWFGKFYYFSVRTVSRAMGFMTISPYMH